MSSPVRQAGSMERGSLSPLQSSGGSASTLLTQPTNSCREVPLSAAALVAVGPSPLASDAGSRRPSVDSASTCASSDSENAESQSLEAAGDDEMAEDVLEDTDGEGEEAWSSHLQVMALANVLTHLASLGCRPQRATCFHSICPPPLSIHRYLERIAKYYQCSDQCLVLSLVYIDRIVKLQPEFVVSPLNVHRLLAISMMVAAKFWDDIFYSNSHYAKVAGVRAQEMNTLEAHFLRLVAWRLHVLPDAYHLYQSQIRMAVQGTAPLAVPRLQAQACPMRQALSDQAATSLEASHGNSAAPLPQSALQPGPPLAAPP